MVNRRSLLLGTAALFVGVAATIVACPPIVFTLPFFSYVPHERPRVFVSHHPIRAIPGQVVTIRVEPDVRDSDGAVVRGVAQLVRQSDGANELKTCDAASDGTFACTFTLRAADDEYVYGGNIDLQNGARVQSRTTYRFRAVASAAPNDLTTLREPVNKVAGLADSYRVQTAFVRDESGSSNGAAIYPEGDFLADIETAVYAGILRDPAYRWRDDQLAFYQYGRTGFTSSFYSGFDTRCGQNPWPADTAFPGALQAMEAVGVLHRHPTSGASLEGTIDPAADLATVFRDCSGPAVKAANVRTFSATSGTQVGRIAKHEFGHAAFGLGDEYTEPNATRSVAAALVNALDTSCCCLVPDSGTGGGGVGIGTRAATVPQLQCLVPGGGTEVRPVFGTVPSVPECPAVLAPTCGATPQAACPQLQGDCVQPRSWLPTEPPAEQDTARPNMFTSKDVCEADRQRAASHPGVEDAARSLGSCRQLCGPGADPCPCEQPEGWIVDVDPAVLRGGRGQEPVDTMGSIAAGRHGGTCAWCVETSLCVRWQLALGETSAEAWAICESPPADAAARERGFFALLRGIADFVKRHVLF
jgi:hypothetical protein